MIEFSGRGILLDIEGTTSSIRFVYDVMFPYVRRELEGYLQAHWGTPLLEEACEAIARDAGHATLAAWIGAATADGARRLVRDEVLRLMDGDVKATGLKQLQGQIWRAGFESGEMQAHVYDDVPPALRDWTAAGCDVRIYSSGSVAAQLLFFGHTVHGDLRGLLRGHYDTTTGPKKEAASYATIAAAFGLPPGQILFLSDVADELAAARQAGLQVALCRRPGNAEPPPNHGFSVIDDFHQLHLVPSG